NATLIARQLELLRRFICPIQEIISSKVWGRHHGFGLTADAFHDRVESGQVLANEFDFKRRCAPSHSLCNDVWPCLKSLKISDRPSPLLQPFRASKLYISTRKDFEFLVAFPGIVIVHPLFAQVFDVLLSDLRIQTIRLEKITVCTRSESRQLTP